MHTQCTQWEEEGGRMSQPLNSRPYIETEEPEYGFREGVAEVVRGQVFKQALVRLQESGLVRYQGVKA